MERTARIVIAIAFAAYGGYHLICRDFITNVVPKPPSWIPWQLFWAVATGIALIAGAIAVGMGNRRGVLIVACGCIVAFLLLHLPRIFVSPFRAGLALEGPGEGLVHAGTAFLVAASLSAVDNSLTRRLILFSKCSLACFMILCGYLHFADPVFVASLIPPWIPWHLFWTYFAGVALILGGLGIMIPKTTQLASLLSGIMILAWVPLVHVPLALQNLRDPGQSVSVFDALSFGATAILIYSMGARSSRRGAVSESASVASVLEVGR